MPTATEKACLECTLPICDDRSVECQFVQIVSRQGRLSASGMTGSRQRGGKRGGSSPEAVQKRLGTQRQNKLTRMRTALAKRREMKGKN